VGRFIFQLIHVAGILLASKLSIPINYAISYMQSADPTLMIATMRQCTILPNAAQRPPK